MPDMFGFAEDVTSPELLPRTLPVGSMSQMMKPGDGRPQRLGRHRGRLPRGPGPEVRWWRRVLSSTNMRAFDWPRARKNRPQSRSMSGVRSPHSSMAVVLVTR